MPGPRFAPASWAPMGVATPVPRAVYRAVTDACAMIAAGSFGCVENGGTMVASAGKPVIDVPGDTPTLPSMTEPVPPAVTAEPPTMAKLCAAPSDWADAGEAP